MRPEAQAWWTEAESEIVGARHLLESQDYHLCAFFCQQAAEKGLKAVWMLRNREHPPRTNNLLDLSAGLSNSDECATALRRLNPHYLASRYPDAANGVPARNYNREIAEELLASAMMIMARCEDLVIGSDSIPVTEVAPEPFVADFAEALKERFRANKVILFGSRARGDWLHESDYDFVVVSPTFEGIPFVRRAVPLYEFWYQWPGVELLCYTPEEFDVKRQQIGIVAEAVREGIEL